MFHTEKSLHQILTYCQKHLPPVQYFPGDIVIDYETNPYLYIFESGNYSVKAHLLQGDNYEIGNIAAPDIIGEGILIGHDHKAVRIESIDGGIAYRLTREDVEAASKKNASFYKDLTTICLFSSNKRIGEANIERMLLYTMDEYIENHDQKNIIPLLQSMKELFSMEAVYWIERHEILENVFAIRYSSENNLPINELINMKPFQGKEGTCVREFDGRAGCTFIFPIQDDEEVYGYLALYHSAKESIPGYIGRIFHHMDSLFIGVIEHEWKKRGDQDEVRRVGL